MFCVHVPEEFEGDGDTEGGIVDGVLLFSEALPLEFTEQLFAALHRVPEDDAEER